MVELRCDPGWVEERLAESFEYRGGPLGVGEAASPEVLEYFEGIFPASTLQVWRTIGFDGLAEGRNWITNPLEWAPAVESWLEGMELPFPPQRWWCVTRTPMGSMQLWGGGLRTSTGGQVGVGGVLAGWVGAAGHGGSSDTGTHGLQSVAVSYER